MNLSLTEQLVRIQSYFPDKIKTAELHERKVIRPEEKPRTPVIKTLPLHDLVQTRLNKIQSEVIAGKSPGNTETTNLNIGTFPDSYKLNDKFKVSDIKDFDRNFAEDSQIKAVMAKY